MLIFDIDGVITDGKRYISTVGEIKSLSLKDLDAIRQLREAGYIVGCISGEDTEFSRRFVKMACLDLARLGCKEKDNALNKMAEQRSVRLDNICYAGDGKYDIPALKLAGVSICPADAIDEVKQISDHILTRKGGEGCIAEICTIIMNNAPDDKTAEGWTSLILNRMDSHLSVLKKLMGDSNCVSKIHEAAEIIVRSYKRNRKLLICGNGGSAADAQHLVTELVGRFYFERKALNAEALTTNTSVITSLANDYDYEMIFARQVEAKGDKGDVLVGITTSGTSRNIQQAFVRAKESGLHTVLMTGNLPEDADILKDTECLIAVPERDTPRIQEMHILIGHIICELVEREIATNCNETDLGNC